MREVERDAEVLRQREMATRSENVVLRGKKAAKGNQVASLQEAWMPMAKKLVPHLNTLQSCIVKTAPLCEATVAKAVEAYAFVSPHIDHDWLLIIYGLILCFFGGHYVALVAAIEAFGMSGWQVVKENGQVCWDQAKGALAAVEADDKVDDDHDGIPDVQQISKDELVLRKARVVMLAVDPTRVMTAVGCLYVVFVAMIATLQIRFAKVVTLGLSIGEMLEPLVDKTLIPICQSLIPREYNRWVLVGVSVATKSFACSVAWLLQTVISALQSAAKGGLIVSRAGLRISNRLGYTNLNHEDTLLDEGVGWALAALGLVVQLSFHTSIPFPFSLALWPADVCEAFLRWLVVYN